MARGKNPARRGRSGSTSAATTRSDDASVQLCVSCSKDVGDNPIGCDTCEHWVHNTEMCSGLPQKVIDAIMEYDGSGINFVCTKCRIRRETSSTGNPQPLMIELMDQLFQQLKGLCSTVQGLVNQVETLSAKPPVMPTPPAPLPNPSPPPNLSQDDYKAAIHKEVKEINEINKRRNSIIIKGLVADSTRDLSQKFSLLTQEVMGTPVMLSDVTCIPNHSNIYRAKILNDDIRKQVLDKSKFLRGTVYNDVFISRDLTYSQRAERFARRQARRSEANNVPQQPPASSSVPAPDHTTGEPVTANATNQGNSLSH